MRNAGIADYKAFALAVLAFEKRRPVSFEVFADDLSEMERQATEIASWGENVYVKIPVTNTRAEFTGPIIRSLSGEGVRLNITAVFTPAQTRAIAAALTPGTPAIVSVFAGRIADPGLDPLPVMQDCLSVLHPIGQAPRRE